MRMVKGLLLGTAAGFVAVASARAADLEADKAPKSADAVKVCSLYGEGFYQIPGEGDICIRIGATARLDGGFNADGNGGPFIGGGADSRNNPIDTRDFLFHGRGTVWFDARQMTQYGVLKAYFSGGFDASTGGGTAGSAFWKRGYIGFAGVTLGKTQSYFDFLNGAFSYGSYHLGGGSDTYDTGTLLAAYTAEFGLGISATASLEDSSTRRNALWDAGTNALAIGSFPGPSGTSAIGSTVCNDQLVTPDGLAPPGLTSPLPVNVGCPIGDYAADQIPDVVGNLRVDQGWGSAQIAGALHQVRAGSYGNNVSALTPNVGPAEFTGQAPPDKWGFALMGGVMANVPTGESDKVWANIVYSQGAIAYTGLSQFGSFGTFSRFNGNSVGAAWALDGVFANTVGPAATGLAGSGIQLTTAWSVGAAFEHHWNPGLRSSVFGVVTQVSYSGDAQAIFCSSPAGPVRTAAGATPNFATGSVLGCNPDFMVWGIGTRTVWNPVRNLDLGAEVMYSRLDQNMGAGVLLNFAGAGGSSTGLYTPQNQSIWSGLLRAQWHFGTPPAEEARS